MKQEIVIYLKGILMGIADLVPGISGGTIAFISGIYEKLIKSLSSIGINQGKEVYSLIKKKQVKDIGPFLSKNGYGFLALVFSGILTALLLGATGISYLFENYQNYTLAFFIGLIISSCFIIFEEIQKNLKAFLLLLLGFLIGFALVFLPTSTLSTLPLSFLFLGGVIASSAMILPGISGSFILLVLGIYPLVLQYLSNPLSSIVPLFVFILGIITGILLLAKILNALLKKRKNQALSMLLGLVIGATFVPLSTISQNISTINIGIVVFLFILGISGGIGIKKLQ